MHFYNLSIQNYYIRAKIPKATILYKESKHNILALVGKATKQVDIHVH